MHAGQLQLYAWRCAVQCGEPAVARTGRRGECEGAGAKGGRLLLLGQLVVAEDLGRQQARPGGALHGLDAAPQVLRARGPLWVPPQWCRRPIANRVATERKRLTADQRLYTHLLLFIALLRRQSVSVTGGAVRPPGRGVGWRIAAREWGRRARRDGQQL